MVDVMVWLLPKQHLAENELNAQNTPSETQREQTGCLSDINSRSAVFYLGNTETQTLRQADVSLKDSIVYDAWNITVKTILKNQGF